MTTTAAATAPAATVTAAATQTTQATPTPWDRMRTTATTAAQAAGTTAGNVARTAGTAATTAATTAARTVSTAATATTRAASTAAGTVGDFWASHISQFRNKFLPDGPTMRPNCGPASVTIALRMIGLDIPGFNGQRSEAVLDKARIIATGKNDTTVGTTDTELERVISASGARYSESTNLSQLLGWVKGGTPVILAGNPSQAWNKRYTNDQVYKFDGGHWVTVSGYDKNTGYYVVNDPLSAIGPIYVSEQELATYYSRNGGLGIGVYR